MIVGLRLREPPRGRHEQLELSEQMLASERGEPAPLGDAAARPPPAPPVAIDIPVEAPPSLGEAWRTVWKIGVLRRIFIALPFLAAAIAGFTSLASLQYQETFHLDAVQRAYLIAPIQVFDLLGLAVGAVIATRLARRDIGLVFRMLAVASVVAAGFAVLFALAPNVPLAFIGNAGIDASLAIVGPGVLASLSLAIPSRVRSVGFSIGALFVLPGLPGAARSSARSATPSASATACSSWCPIFAIGGLIVASAGSLIERDVQQRVDLHAHPDPDADRPPRRPAAAARRARAQRRLRRRRRAGRRGHRDRRGRDRRPASAPTAPASRRCCGPSAAWSRPTTAPSSSTGATSPTCRPTRSPASASPRCPAARGSSPTCASRTTCASRPGRAGGGASTTPT